MDMQLNASFAWQGDVPGSAGLEFGRGNGNASQEDSDAVFTQVSYSVTTSGGNPVLNVSTPVADVKRSYVDLSGWMDALFQEQELPFGFDNFRIFGL